MDRLSVSMAICRGKRLHHGQPFVVFALDLRDPLGSFMADILHVLGDARRTDDILKRAERRDRAPTVVAPASLGHARELLRRLESTPDLDARWGCTDGDVKAVRTFVQGLSWPGEGVAVFLAADDERTVFLFPHRMRGHSVEVIVSLSANAIPANNNRVPPPEDDFLIEDDDPLLRPPLPDPTCSPLPDIS